MKRSALFLCAAALMLFPLLLASCTGQTSAPPEETVKPVTEEELLLAEGGASGYRIVRGDRAEDFEIAAAVSFRKRLLALTGIELPLSDDWEKEGVAVRSPLEIVIGKTNRENEYDAGWDTLSRGGYRVFAAGSRLVILAPDEKGMNAALDAFFAEAEARMKNVENGRLALPASYSLFREAEESFYKRKDYEALNYPEMKAMWLSQYDLNPVYTDGGSQRSEKSYRALLKTVLNNVRGMGLNTVIVQLRPNADSIYPSEIAPPSVYSAGAYGKTLKYDPFAILVEEAHAIGLSVHGWINPLRGMTTGELEQIRGDYRVTEWYRDKDKKGTYLVVLDGRVYLNPAYEEVRELILDGAAEILANYDVDGLHMDDYFYPTTDASFDSAAYRKNGKGKSLGDFRRAQLDQLVSGLWSVTKEICPSALFGISPAGEMDRVYESHYADVYEWCGKPGYLDYICPQVYWGFEHDTCAFDKICERWSGITKCDSVRLIIGMTLGKAVAEGDVYAGSGYYEWRDHKDILSRCVTYADGMERCSGISFFCYQYCFDPVSGTPNPATKEERAHLAALAYFGEEKEA